MIKKEVSNSRLLNIRSLVFVLVICGIMISSVPANAEQMNITAEPVIEYQPVLKDIDRSDLIIDQRTKSLDSKLANPLTPIETLNEDELSGKQFSQTEEICESTETVEIQTIRREPTFTYYRLLFGFDQTYKFTAEQTKNVGWFGAFGKVNFNETVWFKIKFSLPVDIYMFHNETISAGRTIPVYVIAESSELGSFEISYGFSITVSWALRFGIKGTKDLVNYTDSYVKEIPVPLDPVALASKTIDIPIGLLFPLLSKFLDIGIGIRPQINGELLADAISTTGQIIGEQLHFVNDGSIQSFNLKVNEFEDNPLADIHLTNFELAFTLEVVWSLKIELDVIIKTFKFSYDIFTWPKIDLPSMYNETAVFSSFIPITPSTLLPELYPTSYLISDGNNNVAEPGETFDLQLDLWNAGEGTALDYTVEIQFANETLVTSNTSLIGENCFIRPEYSTISRGFSVTIDNSFPDDIAYVAVRINGTNANGQVFSRIITFVIDVLQPNRPYLSCEEYQVDPLGNEDWNTGEEEILALLIKNVGDQATDYNYVELTGVSHGDFSSVVYWDENTTAMGTGEYWVAFITVNMPETFEGGLIDLEFTLYYNDSSGIDYLSEFLITLDVKPVMPDLKLDGSFFSDILGDNDGLAEANETIEIALTLENNGTGGAYSVMGMILASSADVNVTQPYGSWNNIGVNITLGQIDTFIINIQPEALNQTMLFTIYIYCENFAGEAEFFEFLITLEIVQIPEPELELIDWVGLELFGNGDNLPDPGEVLIIYIAVANIGGPATRVAASVVADVEIDIYNSTAVYPALPSGTYAYGEGFLFTIPLGFEGGTVRMYVNASAESVAGIKVETYAYLEFEVSVGDITDPSLTSTNYPTVGETEDLLLFSATAEDTATTGLVSGVDSVYLAIWNASDPEETDPVILEMVLETGEYKVTTTMSNDPNGMVFAIVVFDGAGNMDYYAGASEEGESITQSGSVPEFDNELLIVISISIYLYTILRKKRKY